MIPEIGRRTLLKAVGVATLAGVSSGTAGGEPADSESSEPSQDSLATRKFEVDIDGLAIGNWTEIELPAERSTMSTYRDTDRKILGSTEYDDLVMRRPLSDMALWDWRKAIRQGKLEQGRTTVAIRVVDGAGNTVAEWRFKNAWPQEYDPPRLDGTGYGDNAVRGQEEVVIAYESYRRIDPSA